MKKILLIIISLAVCCSCAENASTLLALEGTKALIAEHADSALTILRSLDRARIRKRATRAQYSLLYAQALDKTGADVRNDSLIRIAARYYRRRGTTEERFLSRYYLARVRQNAEDYHAALPIFMEAEALVPLLGDDYLAGLLYFSMAELNLAQNSFDRALSYYRRSYDSYARAGKHRHRISALIHMAHMHVLQNHYDDVVADYNRAMSDAESMGYTDLQNDCLKSLASTYCDLADIPTAKEYMYQWMAVKKDFDFRDCCIFAQIYLYDNQPDSTEYYARRMLAVEDGNTERIIAAKALLAEAAASQDRYKQAYTLSQEYHDLQDSLYLSHMNNSVAEAELQYKDERLAYERYRAKINRRLTFVLSVSFVLVLCGMGIVHRRRSKRQQKQLDEYFALIDDLSETDSARSSRLSGLFNARFKVLKELAMTYYAYGNTAALEKKVHAILSEKILDASVLADLEQTLDHEYDHVAAAFRTRYPQSGNGFVELLCLLYAGFSPQEICVITNESLAAIYMRKSRLKKKIASLTIADKDKILEILS